MMSRVLTAFRLLTNLGRFQLLLLVATLLFSSITVSYFGNTSITRWTSGLELALALFGLGFTVVYDNKLAFIVLIITLVYQLVVQILLLEEFSRDVPLYVKICAPLVNGLGMAAYAALQIAARGTWGWHAWHAGLTEADAVGVFHRVQLVYATMLMAVANSALSLVFVLCGSMLNIRLVVASSVFCCLYTGAGTVMMALVIAQRDAAGCACCSVLWIVAACASALVLVESLRSANGSGAVTVNVIHSVAFVSQLLVLVAVSRLRPYFRSKIELRRDVGYIIDPSSVTLHRARSSSSPLFSVPVQNAHVSQAI